MAISAYMRPKLTPVRVIWVNSSNANVHPFHGLETARRVPPIGSLPKIETGRILASRRREISGEVAPLQTLRLWWISPAGPNAEPVSR